MFDKLLPGARRALTSPATVPAADLKAALDAEIEKARHGGHTVAPMGDRITEALAPLRKAYNETLDEIAALPQQVVPIEATPEPEVQLMPVDDAPPPVHAGHAQVAGYDRAKLLEILHEEERGTAITTSPDFNASPVAGARDCLVNILMIERQMFRLFNQMQSTEDLRQAHIAETRLWANFDAMERALSNETL